MFARDLCHYVWKAKTQGRTTRDNLEKKPTVAANMINLQGGGLDTQIHEIHPQKQVLPL